MTKFITGNINKFNEIKSILPDIERLDIDLPEIQSLDAHEIISAKLKAALEEHTGDIFVEDTSLYCEGLKGLPGPFIKWFMKSLGREDLARLVLSTGNDNAEARTIVGYADMKGEISYFEGIIKGKIVLPRGETAFGWDPIFCPEGLELTFAQMGSEEKNKISMRRQAAQKLADFIRINNIK